MTRLDLLGAISALLALMTRACFATIAVASPGRIEMPELDELREPGVENGAPRFAGCCIKRLLGPARGGVALWR